MSEKMTCPGCASHTSGVLNAFHVGRPCPVCGLPADAMVAVEQARERKVGADTVARLIELEKRVAEQEHELVQLRSKMTRIHGVVTEPVSTCEEDRKAGW